MLKEFSKNIFLLIFINLLIKPIYILGIDAEVQNQVGDNEYGVYFALFNFCFLFSILLDLGIQNYNSVNVSGNRKDISNIFSNVLATKLILIVVFLSVVALLGTIIYPDKNYMPTLLGLGIIMSLQSFYVFLRSNFSAAGKYKTETYLSALDKLLMILILGYLIYFAKNISIPLFIYGQIAAYLLAIITAFILLGNTFKLSLQFSKEKTKTLLSKAMPFAFVILLMTLYTRMDGVMLERLLDDNAKAAGQYATGFRLMDAANILGYLFSILLIPMFANLLSEKRKVSALVQESSALLFSLATAASIGSWFFAEEILNLIYKDITHQNIMCFKYLMLSFWAMSMSYVFGSLITASGNLRTLNMIFLIGIVINWGLNLFLIPSEMAIGAAKATVATQFFVFFAQFYLARSNLKLSFKASYFLKIIALLGIYFALAYILYNYLPVYWGFKLMTFIILSIFASFLAGFFRLSLGVERIEPEK